MLGAEDVAELVNQSDDVELQFAFGPLVAKNRSDR